MAAEEGQSIFCETCGAQLFPTSTFCHQCGMKITLKATEPPPEKKTEPEKHDLYQIYSMVTNFRYKDLYYDNVKVNWFVTERKMPQIPFEKAIEDYEQLPFIARVNPENYIKQSFTVEEAMLFKKYLSTAQKIRAVVEGFSLPVKGNVRGYRDTPPPPGTDFIILHKKAGYNLPFKVEGIFNLKMADEQIVGDDHSITIVSGINVSDIQKYIKEKEKEKEKERRKP
jgi:hypothetical protein